MELFWPFLSLFDIKSIDSHARWLSVHHAQTTAAQSSKLEAMASRSGIVLLTCNIAPPLHQDWGCNPSWKIRSWPKIHGMDPKKMIQISSFVWRHNLVQLIQLPSRFPNVWKDTSWKKWVEKTYETTLKLSKHVWGTRIVFEKSKPHGPFQAFQLRHPQWQEIIEPGHRSPAAKSLWRSGQKGIEIILRVLGLCYLFNRPYL